MGKFYFDKNRPLLYFVNFCKETEDGRIFFFLLFSKINEENSF